MLAPRPGQNSTSGDFQPSFVSIRGRNSTNGELWPSRCGLPLPRRRVRLGSGRAGHAGAVGGNQRLARPPLQGCRRGDRRPRGRGTAPDKPGRGSPGSAAAGLAVGRPGRTDPGDRPDCDLGLRRPRPQRTRRAAPAPRTAAAGDVGPAPGLGHAAGHRLRTAGTAPADPRGRRAVAAPAAGRLAAQPGVDVLAGPDRRTAPGLDPGPAQPATSTCTTCPGSPTRSASWRRSPTSSRSPIPLPGFRRSGPPTWPRTRRWPR